MLVRRHDGSVTHHDELRSVTLKIFYIRILTLNVVKRVLKPTIENVVALIESFDPDIDPHRHSQ